MKKSLVIILLLAAAVQAQPTVVILPSAPWTQYQQMARNCILAGCGVGISAYDRAEFHALIEEVGNAGLPVILMLPSLSKEASAFGDFPTAMPLRTALSIPWTIPIPAASWRTDGRKLFQPIRVPSDRLWAIRYTVTGGNLDRVMWLAIYPGDQQTLVILSSPSPQLSPGSYTINCPSPSLGEPQTWCLYFHRTDSLVEVTVNSIAEVAPTADRIRTTGSAAPLGWYHYLGEAGQGFNFCRTIDASNPAGIAAMQNYYRNACGAFKRHRNIIAGWIGGDEQSPYRWTEAEKKMFPSAGHEDSYLLDRASEVIWGTLGKPVGMYADMFDSTQNGRKHTRAVNPVGGGYQDAKQLPNTSHLWWTIWGCRTAECCSKQISEFVGYPIIPGIELDDPQKATLLAAAWKKSGRTAPFRVAFGWNNLDTEFSVKYLRRMVALYN